MGLSNIAEQARGDFFDEGKCAEEQADPEIACYRMNMIRLACRKSSAEKDCNIRAKKKNDGTSCNANPNGLCC
eukprot:4717151-Karenia_brevis.AAC.1